MRLKNSVFSTAEHTRSIPLAFQWLSLWKWERSASESECVAASISTHSKPYLWNFSLITSELNFSRDIKRIRLASPSTIFSISKINCSKIASSSFESCCLSTVFGFPELAMPNSDFSFEIKAPGESCKFENKYRIKATLLNFSNPLYFGISFISALSPSKT